MPKIDCQRGEEDECGGRGEGGGGRGRRGQEGAGGRRGSRREEGRLGIRPTLHDARVLDAHPDAVGGDLHLRPRDEPHAAQDGVQLPRGAGHGIEAWAPVPVPVPVPAPAGGGGGGGGGEEGPVGHRSRSLELTRSSLPYLAVPCFWYQSPLWLGSLLAHGMEGWLDGWRFGN